MLLLLFLPLVIGRASAWEDEEPKPTYLSANVGDHVVFNCELDFPQDIPIPYTLKWNKDGKNVFSWYEGVLTAAEPFVGRIGLVDADGYGAGSVNLTSIRESDDGWYQCRVLFPNRNPSARNNGTWYHLSVVGGNLLEVPPINQTALEGDEARFECIPKTPPAVGIDAISVAWYKDGVLVRDLPDLRSRSTEAADGSLTIRQTAMTDLGEYECEARNIYGDRQTARAYLNVQFKAKVIYAPKEVYFPYGRPAILDCHFRSNPPLNNLRWEKDGFLFDPYNVQGVFYKRNGSLYFSRVDDSHAGKYSCTPYNELGTDGPSTPTRVVVQRPPVFTLAPNAAYLRKPGDAVEMACEARDGHDAHGRRPAVVWYRRDGAALPASRHSLRAGNLTLVGLREADAGTYVCAASNQAATITAETQLIVDGGVPRPPFNLTAEAGTTAVTLRWARPRSASSAAAHTHLDYSVWYRPADTQQWRLVRVATAGGAEATIGDLTPGREYEFMLLGQDRYGEGQLSRGVRVRTKSTAVGPAAIAVAATASAAIESFAPVGAPKNVTVRPNDDGSYTVSWEAPDSGAEALRTYVLRWSRGSTDELVGSVETTNTSYTISYLEEDSTYLFQIVAVSDDFQASSEKVILLVPAYTRIRAISISIMTCVAVLGAAFAAFYYLRNRCCDTYRDRKTPIANSSS